MSAVPPTVPPHRHALGLPAGSIRALLALSVLGLLWLLVLCPLPGQAETGENLKVGQYKVGLVYCYLQILMLLILAHFFTAHGHTIRPHPQARSPLGLPRGSVRFLLIAGYLGLAYYLWRTKPKFDYPPVGDIMLLVALLLTAYFVGHLLTAFVRRTAGGLALPRPDPGRPRRLLLRGPLLSRPCVVFLHDGDRIGPTPAPDDRDPVPESRAWPPRRPPCRRLSAVPHTSSNFALKCRSTAGASTMRRPRMSRRRRKTSTTASTT